MPRPTRTVKTPKNAPLDSQSPSPNDIHSTQTTELKSIEIQRAGLGSAIKKATKAKTKPKKRKADEEDQTDNEPPSQKKSRKITVDMLPLALRAKGMKMLVGAHVSVAKGPKEPHFVITTEMLMSL